MGQDWTDEGYVRRRTYLTASRTLFNKIWEAGRAWATRHARKRLELRAAAGFILPSVTIAPLRTTYMFATCPPSTTATTRTTPAS